MTRCTSPSSWCWLRRWISTARRPHRRGSASSLTTARRRCTAPGGSSSRSATVPADDYERWRVFLPIQISDAVPGALTEPVNALPGLRGPPPPNPLHPLPLTLPFLRHFLPPLLSRIPTPLSPLLARL